MNRWMIDFDGVLADLSGAFIRSCNAEFGTAYSEADETDWHWWRSQPQEHSTFVWQTCYPDHDWTLANVEPYEGALEALEELAFTSKPMIVTARTGVHQILVDRWLARHAPGLALPVIAIGGQKGVSKASCCARFKLDVVVEDGPHNFTGMNAKRQTLFLVDRPWNQSEPPKGVQRVESLLDAVERMEVMGKV
jgi:uncharacterized HAD superfamily protein